MIVKEDCYMVVETGYESKLLTFNCTREEAIEFAAINY